MRYVKIFLLHLQESFGQRSVSLVWLLLSIITPLLMILFWRGAKQINDWSPSLITSYYLLAVIMSAFLMTHIENDVARLDIQEGNLSQYLLRPFSYLLFWFFTAISYRVIQGIFGIIVVLFLILFFPNSFIVTTNPFIFAGSICIAVCAFLLSFYFKMIIGILAFWIIEIYGLFEIIEVILTIFAGYLMPIALLPNWLAHTAYMLPFSYMIYFPIIAFEGKLSGIELFKVLSVQTIWILIFYLLYQKLWHAGLKKFSAVGQ